MRKLQSVARWLGLFNEWAYWAELVEDAFEVWWL